MSLTVGQVLQGHAASYIITKILKEPKVFQAKVVPRNAIFPPYKLYIDIQLYCGQFELQIANCT